MPSLADKVDLGERFTFLDNTMRVARGSVQALGALGSGKPSKARPPKLQELWEKLDWDPALRRGNQWYDRIVATMRLDDRGAREKALAKIEADLEAKLVNSGAQAPPLGVDPDKIDVGRIFGDLQIGLLMPPLRKVQEVADRTEQTQRNLHVAFALATYRKDHGRYPAKLEALAPSYLPRGPGDLFSRKGLIYRPSEKGYLLYSVGANGKDDQGRSWDDDPPGDDLAVRMPLPPLSQPRRP
jgi:hypothetical protein